MHQVAKTELEECKETLGKRFDDCVAGATYLHNTVVQEFGSNPLAFVNYVQTFKQVLLNIVNTSGGQSKHLIAGLQKLDGAKQTVDELQKKAGSQKVLLKKAQDEVNVTLQKITKSMEQKAQSKQEVEALQAKCSEDEKMIKERKSRVESELSEIQPQVDLAKKAVGELNPSNLNEIKNFRIPPDPVADVLGAVVQLLGESDTSW